MVAVFPGLLLVLASFVRLVRQLIKEDLPTLERPTNAISGINVSGYCSGLTAVAKSLASIYSIALFLSVRFIFLLR